MTDNSGLRRKRLAEVRRMKASLNDPALGDIAKLCLLREISITEHRLEGHNRRTWRDPFGDILAD